ncbi:hypothetical protein ANCCAN_08917 [Ancylostoma caninum]|uniref:Uncharacterized protein n=1 Tax=Ancylostoma caninum TaxID=29170 RepID=A0A368GKZ3_ANCCA|nr:hypothetical protein ANCCAN_08917 [Ancylostoma caninum]
MRKCMTIFTWSRCFCFFYDVKFNVIDDAFLVPWRPIYRMQQSNILTGTYLKQKERRMCDNSADAQSCVMVLDLIGEADGLQK